MYLCLLLFTRWQHRAVVSDFTTVNVDEGTRQDCHALLVENVPGDFGAYSPVIAKNSNTLKKQTQEYQLKCTF